MLVRESVWVMSVSEGSGCQKSGVAAGAPLLSLKPCGTAAVEVVDCGGSVASRGGTTHRHIDL